MSTTTPSPPPDPPARLNLEHERAYERRHKADRRGKSMLYQRRRRAALKLADAAEQERARERDNTYRAQYRKKNRWSLMMIETRRRNISDSPRRRLSKLRRPEDVEELDLELHQIRNDEILARREKRRECGEGKMGGDEYDDEYSEGEGMENDSAVEEDIA